MIANQWMGAISAVTIRHPNGYSRPVLTILNGRSSPEPPELYVGLDKTTCTLTGRTLTDFAISTVKLRIWPGAKLAQMWLAAAWVGYLQHEALELVTVAGQPVLDPHAEPYVSNPLNRGLRDGFPVELTVGTLTDCLALVMGYDEVVRCVEANWSSDAIILHL